MRREYAVCLGKERIGSATVSQEGLYYRICCQCQLSGSVPCRINVKGEKEADLGLCVPMGEQFGIETRIPIKKVGEGELVFTVMPRYTTEEKTFIAIAPEEPFQYLARLKDAYLVRRNGQTGLSIRDQAPSRQGSGLNP